jgi:hypothetical protein
MPPAQFFSHLAEGGTTMRHLRPYLALLAIASITAACSSSPGSSSGGQSSAGSQASQAAASSGGGGGGGGGSGGGGANGSITYEITGDYQASGELPFLAAGVSMWIESAGGWVANFADPGGNGTSYILLNTQSAEGTPGEIFTFGDGTIILVAGGGDSGMGCTFNHEKNDSSGLKGDVNCTSAIAADATTGTQKHVQVHAEWDAHP